ncbi:MAG: ABC transporter permease [Halanaerobiaceae bacterium]
MSRYLMRRIMQSIPLLIGISLISFFAMRIMPGGPLAGYKMNPHVTQADIDRLRELWGLNEPIIQQYWKWLVSMIKGDWGWSYRSGLPVRNIVFSRIPNTLLLMGLSYIISLIVAIPVGIYSALRRYSVFDYIFTVFAFMGVAIPSFWFGIMLMLLFSATLQWLPSSGMFTIGEGFNLIDRIRHLIMPTLVLSFINMASWSRYMRSSMLETISTDYIRTARAKGLSEKLVILKHALRNALIPIVTLLGLSLPAIVGGAVITERVFAWPGVGQLFVSSVYSRDYPILMASLMLTATSVVVGNMLADIAYGFLDPRIKYD